NVKLCDKITADFPSEPVPDPIVPPRTDGRVHLEAQGIEQFFRGKKWTEITLASLRKDYRGDPSACMTFMTPQAFRYYLPLFMTICLEHGIDADMILLSTIWRLTRGHSPLQDDRWMSERYSFLSKLQEQDIAEFLLVMRDYCEPLLPGNDAEIAYKSYWERL